MDVENIGRRPRRYTVKQAAERMGFSETFVRDLLANNELGHLRRQTKSGTSIRIRERDIEQWEEKSVVCPDLNNKDRPTDLGASQAAIAGTSLGQRDDEQKGKPQRPLTKPKPDDNWSDSLQQRLDRLKGDSEWIGS